VPQARPLASLVCHRTRRDRCERRCLVTAANQQASRGGPDPDSRPGRLVAWSRCAEALAR
jgi:hypothetical protein